MVSTQTLSTQSAPSADDPVQALRRCESRFNNLIELSSDWYWETDRDYRFTLITSPQLTRQNFDVSPFIGKTHWESGSAPVDRSWDQHIATLEAREPFVDLVVRYQFPETGLHYVNTCGRPLYDDDGNFTGYCGISKDVTQSYCDAQLVKLEHAVTRCLADADSTVSAVREVMHIICAAEQWQCCAFWQPVEGGRLLRLVEYLVAPEAGPAVLNIFERSRGLTITAETGLMGWAYQRGEPLWVPDIRRDERAAQQALATATGLHGAFLFPVFAEGQVIGLFAFSSFAVREPDARLIEAVHVIGSQIGQFLQRKQAETVLREREERFRSLTEFSSDWYWEQDDQFRFVDVAGKGLQDIDMFLGRCHWDEFFRHEPVDTTWAEHRAHLEAHEPFRDLILKRHSRKRGLNYFSVSGRPFFDAQGNFKGYRGVGKDITEQKLAEQRIQYLASHDGLTDLPNRSMFSEMLNLAIQNARRYQHKLAVLFIDLDRFKVINDTLGHEAGDTLLREMALRLRQCLRASDVVARLGGDEFVVLLPNIAHSRDVATVGRKILSTLTRPLDILGQECRVTASIGICLFPDDADDEHGLMKNADVAMYRAKEEGKNNFQFYSENIRAQSLERLALETSLRRALERGEFHLHYQAKLALKSERITGVEALLRWRHPDLGLVSPAQFIPLAEETGLIVPIGKWVLKTACLQNMAWQSAGLPGLCMAVNLSARQFSDDELLDDIRNALAESGMPPQLLELELTESMVMQNHERATRTLAAIKAMGVRIAIDDFGVGYSSLAQIKRFPIDTLKVDRSFIRDLPQNAEDRAITQAIIAMGKTLSLTVVAEGVETQEQEAFLREHACDETQGFYFSKPVEPDQFAELLRRHAATTRI